MACRQRSVLVLDRNYFPHRVIGWKRAMKLIYGTENKVEVLQMYDEAPSVYDVSVIRLLHRSLPPFFRKNRNRFYKRYLLIRDNYECQYCGVKEQTLLTVDHIVPRSRGGASSYLNCTTACIDCNNSKSDMTPEEAGLKLRSVPTIPTFGFLANPEKAPAEWKRFLNL